MEADNDVEGVLDVGRLVLGDFLCSSLLALARDGGRGDGEDRDVLGEGADL